MLEVALKILKEITSHSFEAYIVGGFVRDYIMDVESHDIDIATNATPKEIKEIFTDSCLPNEDYGSVTVISKGIRFEITTFRREIEYSNYRKPVEIKYIDDLYEDLLRRDFVINTLCMNSSGEIIDYLGGQEDIQNQLIRTVGDAYDKFSEDSLRILRAVRFATIMNFSLSDDVVDAIRKTKKLLSSLSYYRKKSELDKIFTSPNYKIGIKLLLELGLDEELEIPNLKQLLNSDISSLIGIWSVLDVTDKYPFSRSELSLIHGVHTVLSLNNLDPMTLYNYGLYVNSVAGEIKGLDIKIITASYNNLIIKRRKDIAIEADDISKLLNRSPGKFLQTIYSDLEKEILYHRLDNSCDAIKKYILDYYKE